MRKQKKTDLLLKTEPGKMAFRRYLLGDVKEVNVVNKDVFEVKVGTERVHYPDVLNQTAMHLIKDAKFRVSRAGALEVLSYKDDNPVYMEDRAEMLVLVLQKQMPTFIRDYEFSPESFAKFARFVMRPMSKSSTPKNRKHMARSINN